MPTNTNGYQDPDLLPDGTYRRPQDAFGNDLGAPPNSGWDQTSGTWHPDYASPPSGNSPGQGPAPAPTPNPTSNTSGFDASKVPAGVPNDWAQSFIQRNPGDYGRLGSAYGSQRTGGTTQQAPVSQAYAGYLQQPQAQPQDTGTAALIQQLISGQQAEQTRLAAERTQQDQQRAAMREILMGRLSQAQAPVSADSPGIREVIAARKLESQRGSERERAAMAERLAAQGLGQSGAFDSGVQGIEQARSEADTSAVGNILGGELQNKRQEVQNLLQMAVSMGDTDSARALQEQLSGLDAQLQTARLSEGSRQFNADLGQRQNEFGVNSAYRQNSFLDDLGYRLLALQMNGNQAAGNAFL